MQAKHLPQLGNLLREPPEWTLILHDTARVRDFCDRSRNDLFQVTGDQDGLQRVAAGIRRMSGRVDCAEQTGVNTYRPCPIEDILVVDAKKLPDTQRRRNDIVSIR